MVHTGAWVRVLRTVKVGHRRRKRKGTGRGERYVRGGRRIKEGEREEEKEGRGNRSKKEEQEQKLLLMFRR